MRSGGQFFLLLLCTLFRLLSSKATLDANATVELQTRRTLLRIDSSRGIRDGSLEYLTTLLNGRTKLFATWHDNLNNPFHHVDEDDYVRFIRALTPWILSPPAYPLHPVLPLTLPPLPPLNCGQSRYAHVLTGQPLSQPRIIVDFIPFGYDIDKLELRLYEYYDLVDAFVIYESPKTHGGTEKLLYFKQLMIQKDPRFLPFLSKIIHLSVSSGVLEPLAKQVKIALQEGDRFKLKSHSWDLERAMRLEMIRQFNTHQGDPKLDTLRKMMNKATSDGQAQHALGIQNDADELITGMTMNHLRHCEIKPTVQQRPIYLPCTSFKKNFHWVQKTTDMVECIKGSDVTLQTMPMKSHLWRSGPVVWPLVKMLHKGDTFRYESYDCTHHMGLGAASHMSSVAEPAEYWLKRGSVIEQDHKGAVSPAIIAAGKQGIITPSLIATHAILPWCPKGGPNVQPVHVSTFSQEIQELVNMSIPRVVRAYPQRYPFLLPGQSLGSGSDSSSNTVGIVGITGEKRWNDLCKLPSASTY